MQVSMGQDQADENERNGRPFTFRQTRGWNGVLLVASTTISLIVQRGP